MSEEKEVVGKIVIQFVAKGKPEVEIMGELPARQANALPVYLRRAVRKHVSELRRNSKKVDMSDKGKKLEDLTKEDIDVMNDVQAVPGADELKIAPPPSNAPVNPQPEANNIKDESEAEDGNDEGTEAVRGDDEQPGSEEGTVRKFN